MKRLRLFTLAALVLCAGLSSCQCSDKPDIGPVDDDSDDEQSLVLPTEAPRHA